MIYFNDILVGYNRILRQILNITQCELIGDKIVFLNGGLGPLALNILS